MTVIFGVAGWKNSGKTTLMSRLVAHFDGVGLKTGAIKRAHHSIQLDTPGTDSFRYRESGAAKVALVSESRVGYFEERRDEGEPELSDVIDRLMPCDIILIEGFKTGLHPKIETRRKEGRENRPLGDAAHYIAAVAGDSQDFAVPGLPFFDLNDIPAIADFVLNFDEKTHGR